jgi:hypothetical protein
MLLLFNFLKMYIEQKEGRKKLDEYKRYKTLSHNISKEAVVK